MNEKELLLYEIVHELDGIQEIMRSLVKEPEQLRTSEVFGIMDRAIENTKQKVREVIDIEQRTIEAIIE